MNGESLIVMIVVGLIAGWLASAVVGGIGYGLIGDIIIGIVGAFIGSWLFAQLGIAAPAGLLGSIIVAFVGAAVLLLILRALAGGRRYRRL
jgi:uncharacterized membrane protein YeaQ/YmgE (transglycosylase-associated protein family)